MPACRHTIPRRHSRFRICSAGGTGDSFYRLRPDLGTEVGKLLTRALAFDANLRPAPVTAFTGELADAFLAAGIDSRLARLWVVRRSRRWILPGGAAALAGAGAGGWWLRDRLTPLAPAERVIDLPLPSEPLEHGVQSRGIVANGVLPNSESSGYQPAIQVTSADQGGYYYGLSRSQIRAANRQGWKMDFEAEVHEGEVVEPVRHISTFARSTEFPRVSKTLPLTLSGRSRSPGWRNIGFSGASRL